MMYFEISLNGEIVFTCNSITDYMRHMRILAEAENTQPIAVDGGNTRINDKVYVLTMGA